MNWKNMVILTLVIWLGISMYYNTKSTDNTADENIYQVRIISNGKIVGSYLGVIYNVDDAIVYAPAQESNVYVVVKEFNPDGIRKSINDAQNNIRIQPKDSIKNDK